MTSFKLSSLHTQKKKNVHVYVDLLINKNDISN